MTAEIARKVDTTQIETGNGALDPSFLTKRKNSSDSLHLNLRLVGEDARIYKYLASHTDLITDSLRVRDCIRVVAYLIAMKQRGTGLCVEGDLGEPMEILDYIGAFSPQSPIDRKRRSRA